MSIPLQTVDVFLSALNQAPADHQGPIGRLTDLHNVKAFHFTPPTRTSGLQLQLDPRDGFSSFSMAARNVSDGTVASASWSTPELLASLGSQLVSVDAAIPRVYNGSTWSYYPNARTLAQTLAQEVLYTSQHTIQVPDHATINGVRCSVWTETTVGSTGPLTTTVVGFTSSNGTQLVQPAQLYAANASSVVAQARVVQDGTRFFVFFNTFTSVNVKVYDTHGALLGSDTTTIPLPSPTLYPGPWDVTACPTTGGYTVLFAGSHSTSTDAGVDTYAVGWNGSVVTFNHVLISAPTVHAKSRVAWLTNDFVPGSAYLATLTDVESAQIWAYEITNQAVTHTYQPGVSPADGDVDSLAGFVTDATFRTVVISYTELATNSVTPGPPHDPQLRQTKSFACTTSNTVTQIRTTQSLNQVSRAFAVDGEYYTVGYYQSGAGTTWTPTKISVTPILGDTMIGAAQQPLAVTAGDKVIGSPIALNSEAVVVGPTITITDASGAASIASGDTVSFWTAGTGLTGYGIQPGTVWLRWKFAALGPTVNSVGGRLTIASSSGVTSANGSWDVVYQDGTYFYTSPQAVDGHILPLAGTFSTAGTAQRIAMVAYEVNDLSPYISNATVPPFIGGTLVVTGAGVSTNNGTFTVGRLYWGSGANYGFNSPTTPIGVVWVPKTTQTTPETHAFAATLTPVGVNQWTFAAGDFDNTYNGAKLNVTADPIQPANVQSLTITSVQSATTLTTGSATSVLPQVFTASGATVEIDLTTQVPYTFAIGAVTADYTYLGGILSLQGAANPNNDGTYQIVQVNADGSFVATPTNGLSNQVNEGFGPSQSITIVLSPAPVPQFQPTWFLIPLTSAQPVAGRFEYGLAYADWRTEGDNTLGPTLFPGALTTPQVTANGVEFVLPYRAENVTTAEVLQTPAGAVVIPGQETTTNTVGLKVFTLSTSLGQAYATSDQLSIPGPMAGLFTGAGFFEDGINVAPEQPFLVSQSVASSGQLALSTNATYEYVVVFEYTEDNGDRVFSIPSPTLEVAMSGSNNVATIGGRLPFPLDSTGKAVANTYGVTCRLVSVGIYRTAWINGTPTTTRYKVTNDLNPNGLAPVSTANASGFSFPNSFTWQYVDSNPDAGLNGSEPLYTDAGYKPRYPSPAFSRGVVWRQRKWCIGYDGAIWCSNEETEGLATSFSPALRVTLPTTDRPKALAVLEDYLIILGSTSSWYLPAQTFPDATGANGSLPTPVPLPFGMGSKNGYAVTTSPNTPSEGVAFDSSSGGVWLIDRALRLSWLSMPVQTALTTDVTGLAVDSKQRLIVQQTSGPWCIYDGVPNAWYLWDCPTAPKVLATYLGQPTYADTATVNTLVPGQVNDQVNGVTTGIAPDFTLAPVSFANVRGVKLVHELQLVGKYLGAHRLNAVISYPDQPGATPTSYTITPDSTKPYVIPVWPTVIDATTFTLRVYADFVGVGTPGASFSLELVSAEVGVMPGGLSKVRAPGT